MVDDDLIELFYGSPESAKSLQDFLARKGIHALVRNHFTVEGGTSASVHVFPDEAENASRAFSAWNASSKERVGDLARRIRNVFLISLLLPGTWLVAHTIAPGTVPQPQPALLLGTWVAGLVIIGRIEQSRQNERIQMPAP